MAVRLRSLGTEIQFQEKVNSADHKDTMDHLDNRIINVSSDVDDYI